MMTSFSRKIATQSDASTIIPSLLAHRGDRVQIRLPTGGAFPGKLPTFAWPRWH